QVKAMRDVTRGGLGTMLNELANTSGTAIEIEEENIPVRDDVRGFCDILGLDPLYMGNEGKMLAVVEGEDANKALAQIKSTELGKDALILGYVKSGKGVTMKTRLGGTRVVDMLYGEGLPRIC
ncbi:MAG: AIR synthase-related protein, partial [Clostridiales bacterium]